MHYAASRFSSSLHKQVGVTNCLVSVQKNCTKIHTMALNIDYFDILPTDRWLGGAGVYWLTFNSSALMIEDFLYFHLSVGKPFWLHLPGGCNLPGSEWETWR